VYDSALVSTLTLGDQDEDDEDRPSSLLPGTLTGAQASRVKRLVVELARLGVPRSDAEDVMQQVFMVTTRRIDDIRPDAERSFLYGVCIRMASRARRTRDRRREVDGDGTPERVDPGLRPDEQLDRAEARAVLETILTAMPLELRTVFTLYELEQVTMIEIAQLLGVPQGTVASRLRRARAIFAEHRARIEAKLKNSSGDRISGFERPALWTTRTKEET
jgi:RNA polymerase sigma-70 factor (ECF subfamily)